jgi:hypothetical protein
MNRRPQQAVYYTASTARGATGTGADAAWDHRHATLEGKYARHVDGDGNPVNDAAGSTVFRTVTPSWNPTTTPPQSYSWTILNMPLRVFQAIANDSHHFRRYDSFRPRGEKHRLWPDGMGYQSILPISSEQFDSFPAGRPADFQF